MGSEKIRSKGFSRELVDEVRFPPLLPGRDKMILLGRDVKGDAMLTKASLKDSKAKPRASRASMTSERERWGTRM